MKQRTPSGSMWRLLPAKSDRGQDKSMLSRESSTHSRYTPKREQSKGQGLTVTLGALKQKIGSLKQLKFQLPATKETKVCLSSPKSMSFLAKRVNSMEEDLGSQKMIEKYRIRSSNIMDMKLQIQNQDNDYQQPQLSSNLAIQSKHQEKYQNRNHGLISQPIKLNMFTARNKSFDDQQSFHQGKDIDGLYQYCSSWLNSIEKEMMNERVSVMKMLDEKQRQFIKIKEKLLKRFERKANLATDREIYNLQNQLKPSIVSKRQDAPLMRVTSQKIISKLSFSPKRVIQKTDSKISGLSVKPEDTRSFVSASESTCKENFDVIFNTINKMKKDLDRPASELQAVKNLQIPLEKQIPLMKQQKKAMKVSLMGFKNLQQESNKKNKISQIVNQQSSSNNL